MHDIAREAGVAAGTLYLYVQSKEALFDLALRYGMGIDLGFLAEIDLPFQSDSSHIVSMVRERGQLSRLMPALANDSTSPVSHADVHARLGELYDMLASHRYAVRMVERSAREWSELAFVFFECVREPLIDRLAAYLSRARAESNLTLPGDAAHTARLLVEYMSWSAVHRHFDGADLDLDDHGVRELTLAFFGKSLLGDQGE